MTELTVQLNPFPPTTVLASIINIIAAAAAAVIIIPIVVIAMGQLFPPERPNCSSLRWSGGLNPRLPDGDYQIFKLYVFGPSGLKDYGSATLRYKIRSLPFLGLRPHALHPGAVQGKEGINFCHLATLQPQPSSTLLNGGILGGSGGSFVARNPARKGGFPLPPLTRPLPPARSSVRQFRRKEEGDYERRKEGEEREEEENE